MKIGRHLSLRYHCGRELIVIAGIIGFSGTWALASENRIDLEKLSVSAPSAGKTAKPQHPPLTPDEIFNRTEAVFKLFGVEAEDSYQAELDQVKARSTPTEFTTWLRFLDPKAQFARFFDLGSLIVSSFSDRDGKRNLEFSRSLFDHPMNHHDPVLNGKKNSEQLKPLTGLRIAIDPGHMGTEFWDHATGKWVHDRAGKVVSEGLINLQVSLLLKTELEGLGANVMLTRSTLAPVTKQTPTQIDLGHFGRNELRMQSLQPWFLELLESANGSEDLEHVFRSSAKVKSLFSEAMRMTYFILREDIYARSEKIAAFNPDLTLVIHFDAADTPGSDPQLLDNLVADRTRAYVPGALSQADFATAETRAHLVEHLLQPSEMQRSVALSQAVVRSISTKLNVPAEVGDGPETVAVTPGVFARNLELTRMVTTGAVSYVECLMYGSENEFNKLAANDYSMQIDGQSYPYSARLRDVVMAIRDGVVNFSVEQ